MATEMFMPDGTPRCPACGKPMHKFKPFCGRFKGQVQEHCWECDCSPGIVLSVG